MTAGRSGHIAINFKDNLLIWGGHGPDTFCDESVIWIFDMHKESWSKKLCYGDVPLSISSSCYAVIDNILFVIGGYYPGGQRNTVRSLDLDKFIWSEIMVSSPKPSPRDKLDCWVHYDQIVCFGGYGPAPTSNDLQAGTFVYDVDPQLQINGWNNDLISFNTLNNTWEALPYSQSLTPAARAAHTCTKVGDDTGYLFGGRHQKERLNDLHMISLVSYVWCRIHPFNDCPIGRSWHSLTNIDNNNFLLFGGYSTDDLTLSDAWIFNLKLVKWTQLAHECDKEKRKWHTANLGIYPGQVLIFGGCDSFIKYHYHITTYQLSPLPLKRLCILAAVKYKYTCGSLDDLPGTLILDVANSMWNT